MSMRVVYPALALLLVSTLAFAEAPLRIFAAASLRGALEGALEQHPDEVRISYGGSGAMARQVSRGAPVDLVILASTDWGLWLKDEAPPRADTPGLMANRMILIGPAPSDPIPKPTGADLLARLGTGRLAMGQRDAVPAGQYARAWLESIGAWETLAPRLAEADNVRGALAFVTRGEAPLGIVYASDAIAEPRVAVLWDIPADMHPPIRYPALSYSPEGTDLLRFLQESEAQAAFEKAGFIALAPNR